MKSKKIISGILAFILAFGVCTAVPVSSENGAGMAIVASAEEDYKTVDGFVLKKDDLGRIFVDKYEGEGGDITIPKEAAYIGYEAFIGNNSITSVTFPEGTTKYCIGEYAFAYCTNLKTVTIEGDVGEGDENGIWNGAFLCCHSLETVKFLKRNAHVSFIHERAFDSCYSLKSINLPSGTKKLYNCVFDNCVNLSSITIPKDTAFMGEHIIGYMYGFDSSDDYFARNNWKHMKADGKAAIYYRLPGRTEDEAKKYAKEFFGDDSKVEHCTKHDYESFCYPIKQCKITLNVYKGSSAEKWAKENGIKYKTVSSSSDTKKLSNLKASKTTKNSVTLSWDEVNGASAYRVYKYNAKTKKYEKYKDVTSTTCKVTGLSSKTKYKFKVSALKKSGKSYKTGRSATLSVTTK